MFIHVYFPPGRLIQKCLYTRNLSTAEKAYISKADVFKCIYNTTKQVESHKRVSREESEAATLTTVLTLSKNNKGFAAMFSHCLTP